MKIDFQKTISSWRKLAILASSGTMLLFVGCADDSDEYTATETEDAYRTTDGAATGGGTTGGGAAGTGAANEGLAGTGTTTTGGMAPAGAGSTANQQADTSDFDESQTSASQQFENPQFEGGDLEATVRTHLRTNMDLSQDELNAINIDVEQDRVVLSGTAPSQEMIDRIEEEVSNIEQVSSVENNLSE